MKIFEWDTTKNEALKQDRGISFEEVVFYMAQACILDIVPHPSPDKHPDQKMFIVKIDQYAYLVPLVEKDNVVFLKTVIPSRKATKKYLKEE